MRSEASCCHLFKCFRFCHVFKIFAFSFRIFKSLVNIIFVFLTACVLWRRTLRKTIQILNQIKEGGLGSPQQWEKSLKYSVFIGLYYGHFEYNFFSVTCPHRKFWTMPIKCPQKKSKYQLSLFSEKVLVKDTGNL